MPEAPVATGVVIDSPVGPLTLDADADDRLCGVWFGARPGRGARSVGVLADAQAQLVAYFERRLERFELPLALQGSAWQLAVWRELAAIPYGTTVSYGEMARRLGRPDTARAVGAANGANPISIVLPCHRVIGADGSLTGYGGGLRAKRFLLELEGASATAQGRLVLD